MSTRWTFLATALLVVAIGCDSGPSGPGALIGRVSGPSLGAVLMEVEGAGINGFSGLGDTQIYTNEHPDRPGAHRVLLVHPQGGDMSFEIAVDDVGMEGPSVIVIQVAGADNLTISSSSATVTIER